MFDQILSSFYPEPTGDLGRDRNAQTLQFTCLLFAFAWVAVALLDTISGEPVPSPILISLVGLVAAAAMNRAGRTAWAGRTTVLSMMFGAILLVVDAHDGIRSHAMLVFPGLLLISIMLLDRRSYLTISGIVLLAVAALGSAEKQGLTRVKPGISTPTSYESIFYVDLTLAVFALIGSRIANDVQRDVSDLRASIDQLSGANLELTKTAELLSKSEERFRATFFQAAVGIAQADIDHRWIILNDRFCELLGYTQAELRGKHLPEVIHPDDREASLASLHQLLSGAISSSSQERRYIRKDGATAWARVFTSLVRDHQNQPECFITVVEDITEKIQAELALRISEERLALAQNAAQLGVWDHDLRTNVIAIGGQYARLLGLSPDRTTLTVEDWTSLIHLGDRERMSALRLEARQRTHTFDDEFRVIWPGGSVHWLHAKGNVLLDDFGRPSRSLGVVWDVTERKEAEAKLRESEERFRRVFEEGPIGIALVARDYRFMNVNSALCQMVCYTEAELLQKTFADITHPDDEHADVALAERLFRGEIPFYRTQKRYVKKTGDNIWINLTASIIHDAGGEPIYGLAMVEDISEIKRIQEEAFARQKLESVGTLANGIAHDFNNILCAVLAEAEAGMAELSLGSHPVEELKAICDAAKRGSEIVRELMIYAGKESKVPELVDVSQTIEEMLALLRVSVSKRVAFKTDLDKDVPVIRANASQISRLVMNLVTNASEAIGDRDGTIHLTTRRVTVGSDSPVKDRMSEGEYLQLEVSDTGIGMSPETQARVFDPFYSTKFIGRGLGLAVVDGVVRGLGGSIHLASELGRGSTFLILLPSCGEHL